MVRILINPGHGGKDGGATGHGLVEKDLALTISKGIVARLKNEYDGVDIRLFRNRDVFHSLSQIAFESNKWKADIFVSIHINAGGGTGFESFVFNGKKTSTTVVNQTLIHNAIMSEIKGYGVADRGKKSENFAVLRETLAPAILTETLFIDTKKDADLLKQTKFINSVVAGHVKGIAKAMKLKKKKVSKVYHRVVVGSFKEKKNADSRVKKLEEDGYDSFVEVFRK